MRTKILQLKDLGRMPNESINDPDNIVEVIRSYDELLSEYNSPYHLMKLKYWYKSFPRVLFMICSGTY